MHKIACPASIERRDCDIVWHRIEWIHHVQWCMKICSPFSNTFMYVVPYNICHIVYNDIRNAIYQTGPFSTKPNLYILRAHFRLRFLFFRVFFFFCSLYLFIWISFILFMPKTFEYLKWNFSMREPFWSSLRNLIC